MTAHRIYGGLLFLAAAAILATTFSERYAGEPLAGDVSTVFMPRAFLLAWMAFAALLFFRGPGAGADAAFPKVDWTRLGAVALVSLGTALAMLHAGFLIATVPGFWIFAWTCGYRRPVPLTLVSAALPLGVWFLFNDVFGLPLPGSPWFRDF